MAGELTAASDVYALGLTLYQCLTGKVPLHEDTAVATLMLRQRSRPPRVILERDDCPAWLDRLIRRMLDPEPGRRPSAAEVERAFPVTSFAKTWTREALWAQYYTEWKSVIIALRIAGRSVARPWGLVKTGVGASRSQLG